MAAHFIPVGEPAHDAERQALRFLVEGLPPQYTVYGNAWLVEHTGVVYELDAVVVAPHAIFVVEIKGWRGRITGTDHDWYIPEPVPSPIKKNRVCAQILKSLLKRASYDAGQPWVQGLVFLSATTQVDIAGPASDGRVHARDRILAALQDPTLVQRLSGRSSLSPTSGAPESEVLRLLTGSRSRGPRPLRHVREYEIVDTLGHHETYLELLGKNRLSDTERVLRVYPVPELANDAQRDRITERTRWEAQVLQRLGRIEGILRADPPFHDDGCLVLPFEHFGGITLSTWIERYGPNTKTTPRADLRMRTDLWLRIARAIGECHEQGIVHRLLRPEVILVEDTVDPKSIRITGFELAKQLSTNLTVALMSALNDDRLRFAAPEVVRTFTDAEPASDQFSLGVLLGLLLTGKPLFESTRELLGQRRLLMRVRDLAPRTPLSLDDAVTRMLEIRAPDRYSSLDAAIHAVLDGRETGNRALPGLPPTARTIDADNLEAGMRIGQDYEIVSRLGQGGMSVVYAARHLVSGRTRALKIATQGHQAEDALRGEYKALTELDHSNIVRVIDLTKVVEGRLTLVMERVGGETLRQWLARGTDQSPQSRRRLAEDLLAGLDYLEQRGVIHKDLKPDNLLVADGRLILIDFSLAGIPEDATYSGTALYRDPALVRWTHAADRYAAALCLFELYAGRHAFDGRAPGPGESPAVTPDDIAPTGLAAFFHKALSPQPELRFPSARATRDALLVALGDDAPARAGSGARDQGDATRGDSAAPFELTTPLASTDLSRRAVNALSRTGLTTVQDLLPLDEHRIRAIHAIGTKTASELIAFRAALLERRPQLAPAGSAAIVPELATDVEPLTRLPLTRGLRDALVESGLTTIGAVAGLGESKLLSLPGIGRRRLTDVVDALRAYRDRVVPSADSDTLDELWSSATSALTDRQRQVLEKVFGLDGTPRRPQGEMARDLGLSQSQVSNELTKGLAVLDRAPLTEVMNAFDEWLEGFHGIVRADVLAARCESIWRPGDVTGYGLVRFWIRSSAGRAHSLKVKGIDAPVVTTARISESDLAAFVAELDRLANQWPPAEPEATRRSLSLLLPNYDGDPIALGVRLSDDLQLTDAGQLFIGPVQPHESIEYVLDKARDPVPLAQLGELVRRVFGDETSIPDPDHLLDVLRELDCRVQGDFIIPGHSRSILARGALAADPTPFVTGPGRSPEAALVDMLRDAARTRGFRMVIAPPEHHREIGRSVAAAIDATWISFEDAFFDDHGADLSRLERAERFIAQRDALTEAAESTLSSLVEEHGRAGTRVVLGDTGLLGLCDALDLPRRLYDDTLSSSLGFWVLVLPGVIHNRQPRFNEGPPIWHLEGATLALQAPLPVPLASPPAPPLSRQDVP